MKAIYARFTPRVLFLSILAVQLSLGAAHSAVVALQYANIFVYIPLQYLFQALYMITLVLAVVLALRFADRGRYLSGLPYLLSLLFVLFLKDILANFFVYRYEYQPWDALLLALVDSSLGTLVLMGIVLTVAYSAAYLFFLYARKPTEPPSSPWSFDTNHMIRATFLVTLVVTSPVLVTTCIDVIAFLIDALWMPTAGELVNMVFDLLLVPAFGFLGYFLTALYLCHIPAEAVKRAEGETNE